MGKLTFILGGARSGKSTHALRLAEPQKGRVAFIATATAEDDDMRSRITRHRAERPAHWQTLEIPRGVATALQNAHQNADLYLLDCLTLLVSNTLLFGVTDFDQIDEAAAEARVTEEIHSLLEAITNSSADWIIISNEVGLGLVPPYPLGRIYRDLLGRANQQVAARASEVLWLVAGIPVPIQSFRTQSLK